MIQDSPSDTAQESTLAKAFNRWVFGLNGAGTIWIFLLMLLINADVIMRFLFNAPIDGVPEIVELSIVGIVFLQLGDAVKAGRLTRSDGLYNKLSSSYPRLGHGLGIFFELAGIAFFTAILAGAIPRLIEAYQRGYYAGNEGIFLIPVWPTRLILCIGCLTVILVFLSFIKQHIIALAKPIRSHKASQADEQ